MTIKEVRNIIFRRDGNKCYKCGSTEMLCLDHLLPKPLFQIHKVSNIMTLCLRCNFQKGAHPLPEEEYFKRESYIIEANSIFTKDQINEMDEILSLYFNNSVKHRRKQTHRRLHTYRSGSLWKLM